MAGLNKSSLRPIWLENLDFEGIFFNDHKNFLEVNFKIIVIPEQKVRQPLISKNIFKGP